MKYKKKIGRLTAHFLVRTLYLTERGHWDSMWEEEKQRPKLSIVVVVVVGVRKLGGIILLVGRLIGQYDRP